MLGGVEMSLRLRDHLALAFNSMKKSKNDVRRNVRSMAKLFKESNRVKHVLSANADHHAQIEGLFEDKDFKFKVSRDDVENMCEDLFPIVNDVIAQALNGSVAMEDIKEIILMGGATRMPKIQEIIKKATGRQDLGKGINTDEAAAMGAVYQAAHLSKGFRVKKFAVKDGNHFPIQVAFDRIRTDIDSGIVDTKNVKRLIFTSLNPYPQKKVMTFNKNHDDFSFSVGYSKLSDSELNNFDATTIFETSLTGVSDAYKANHVENSIESKGVKAHFRLDDSGLVNVDSVEMIFERLVDEPEEESTLTMLGNKFSSLFGSSETKDESNSTTEDNKTDKEVNSTTNLDNSTDKDGNSTKEAKPPIVKLKPKIIKVNITSSTTILDLLEPTEAKITASFNILDGLRKIDQLKAKKEKIMNELESFTVEFAEKLEKDIYIKHSKSKERETIKKALSEASEWIYEQDMDTPVETYEKKFVDLQTVANAVEDRVIAYEQLPLAYAGLDDILNYSRSFYANMSNHTVGDNDLPGSKPFTLIERKKLRNLNKDTTKWFKEQKKLQDALNPTEKPIITIGMISLKIQELDREVKYLLGKAKYFKPLPKPYIKTANATATNSTLNQNETKTNNASAEEPPKGGSTEIPLTDKKDKSHSPEDEL